MTDTPDLRTLAAEVFPAGLVEALARVLADQFGGTWLGYKNAARRGLAAVLPAHRRQVLAEALGQPLPPGADGPMRTAVESVYPADWVKAAQRGAAANLRMWAWQEPASAAPETAPRPRQGDETAPAVPEATPDTREANPYRLVMTPQGERVAYLPSWEDLPLGWVDLGPYPTDPKAGDDGR